MMISAVRTAKPAFKKGFTLLEIVIVLTLAAILTGGAVGMMVYSSDERALRDASGQIEVLAKKARTRAILNQRPYAIVFHAGTANLVPFGQSSEPITATTPDAAPPEAEAGTPLITLPEDMQLSILRWNTGEKWIRVQHEVTQVWRFDPEGLSEPIGIRYQINNSWQQDIYHPLTATIQSTEIEAAK